jgi:hypothetical protein
MQITLSLLTLVGLLVSSVAVGVGVGYTLGAKAMWPVYAIAGVAGLVIACTAAYYFWYKPRQQRAQSSGGDRRSASIKASADASMLPLFRL